MTTALPARQRGGASGIDGRGKKRKAPVASKVPRLNVTGVGAGNEDGSAQKSLLVDCKYANELPQPPVAKLLRALPAPEKLYRYRPTALEMDHRPFMLSEEDLLQCVELQDPDAYGSLPAAGSMRPPCPPKDAALLRDDDVGVDEKQAETRRKQLLSRTEAFHREAFGLQLPQLVTNDTFTERQRYTTGLEATEKKLHRNPPGFKSMEEFIEKIETTFKQAQLEPVHPTNPSLKPKRVLSIVPDVVLWQHRYRQVSFDELPQEPKQNDLLFKSQPSPRATTFGSYSAPQGIDTHGGGSFERLQNYYWDNRGHHTRSMQRNQDEVLLLSMPPADEQDGEVRFVMSQTILKLKKAKAHSLELENTNDSKSMFVSYRDLNGQEHAEMNARMRTVLEEEPDNEDATTFHYVDGEWEIRGAPGAASSGAPSARQLLDASSVGDAASEKGPPSAPQSPRSVGVAGQ